MEGVSNDASLQGWPVMAYPKEVSPVKLVKELREGLPFNIKRACHVCKLGMAADELARHFLDGRCIEEPGRKRFDDQPMLHPWYRPVFVQACRDLGIEVEAVDSE